MREMWVGVVGVLCCLVNSVAVATASRDGGWSGDGRMHPLAPDVL